MTATKIMRALVGVVVGTALSIGGVGACSTAPGDSTPGEAVGTTTQAVTSADTGGAHPFRTAPHATLPLVPNWGGPGLTHPHLVTVTYPGGTPRYPGSALESAVQSFGDYIVQSPWLSQVGAEYGVGLGTHTHVLLTDPAPTNPSQADVESYITSKIADGTLPGPLTTSPNQYLYMIFFPPQTANIEGYPASLYCAEDNDADPGAWHGAVTTIEAKYAYAIMPMCGMEPFSNIEIDASHEFIEAATDTYYGESFGYFTPTDSPWFFYDNELADRCEWFAPVQAGSHTFTAVWSNSAAAAGTPPCVPAPSTPYFNVSPVGYDANKTQVVSPGETLTFDVVGWSTAPAPDWWVRATGNSWNLEAPTPPTVTFSAPTISGQECTALFPTTSSPCSNINNGAHVTLTIAIPADAPPNSVYAIALESTDPEYTGYWEALSFLQFRTADTTSGGNGGDPDDADSTLLAGLPFAPYILGTTSDDFAIYTLGGSVFAVPISGGEPTIVTPGFDQYPPIVVTGTSVALWSLSDAPVQQLQHWTAATGLKVLSQASIPYVFEVSPDGSKVLYTDDANGATNDLVVANLDGSDPRHVLVGTPSWCLVAEFQGNAVVAQSCPANGGGTSATISVFAPPAYAERDVATGLVPTPSLVLDGTSEHAFVASNDAEQAGSVVSLATAAHEPIAQGVTPWYLKRDASVVLYANGNGALMESPVSNPSPMALAASGAEGLLGVSHDESAAAYYSMSSPPTTDLYLTTTTPGGTPMTLATQNAYFDGFTTDSRAAVYVTGYDPSTFLGTLQATTLGGVTVQFGVNVYPFLTAFGPGGAVAALDDSSPYSGLGSIHVTDLAKGGSPALIATAVGYFALSATGTRVVYTAQFPKAGLYVANIGDGESGGGSPDGGHRRHGAPPWASRGEQTPGHGNRQPPRGLVAF